MVRPGSGQSGSSPVAGPWGHLIPISGLEAVAPGHSSGCRSPDRLRRGPLRLPGIPVLAVALLSALWLAGWASGRRLVYNATDSEARGWYLAAPVTGPLTRAQFILFPVPTHVAGLVADRGWLPSSVPRLKRVGALAGDTVCIDAVLRIRSEAVGPVLSADAAGRPLPVSRRGCFTVAPGHVFPIGRSRAGSFDGRYFGEIPVHAVEATAVPLWTFP